MKQLTIRTFSLSLLAVFLFNTCVYGIVLPGMLYFHKAAEKDSLHKPCKEIIQLRISSVLVEMRNDQFRWEKEWEFEYLGEMYDVVDSKKGEDTWVFSCKHDTREEILKNRATRESQRNQDKRDTQSKKNLKVGSEYFSELNFVHVSASSSCTFISCSSECNYDSHRSVPHPPPDHLVITLM